MTKPKELYRFVDSAQIYTVTSADSDEVYNSETYTAIAIGRDESEQKNELSKANITVTVSLDNAMGRKWMRSILDNVVNLSIFSKDIDSGTTIVIWKGRLTSVKPNAASIELVFESVFTSMRRPGLRGKYQRSCPHVLYGRGCNLDKSLFVLNSHISDISASGTVITAPGIVDKPDGYFIAGMIEGPDGAFRFIVAQSGTQLTLIRPLDSLTQGFIDSGGMPFYANIYPGCDRIKETCKDRFDNLDNYGGFPFIPLNNPMAGSSIV